MFPLTVQLTSVVVPPSLSTPPPLTPAEFPLSVQFVRLAVAPTAT